MLIINELRTRLDTTCNRVSTMFKKTKYIKTYFFFIKLYFFLCSLPKQLTQLTRLLLYYNIYIPFYIYILYYNSLNALFNLKLNEINRVS